MLRKLYRILTDRYCSVKYCHKKKIYNDATGERLPYCDECIKYFKPITTPDGEIVTAEGLPIDSEGNYVVEDFDPETLTVVLEGGDEACDGRC